MPVTQVEYLDQPPADWIVLDVMRRDENPRGRDWTALMVDVDPDELKNCPCDFPPLFYVHPDHYRPWISHGTPMLRGQAQKPDRCLEACAPRLARGRAF